MKLCKRIYDILWAAVHPKFWIMIEPYSREWDEFLLDKMKNQRMFTIVSRYVAHIDGTYIWIEDYPYGAFTRYSGPEFRPARRTIAKLQKWLSLSMSSQKVGDPHAK